MTGPERVAARFSGFPETAVISWKADNLKIPKGMKFYHASPKRFRHGDILRGDQMGGANTNHPNVCMTTKPDPHATISTSIPGWKGYKPHPPPEVANKWVGLPTKEYVAAYDAWEAEQTKKPQDWYIYEVEPLTDPTYNEGWHEYQTKAAKVIRVVGKAKALLQKGGDGDAASYLPQEERRRQLKQKEREERRQRRDDERDERVAARFTTSGSTETEVALMNKEAAEAASKLEGGAKAIRMAAKTITQITSKRSPSESKDGSRWEEAEKVLKAAHIKVPDSGFLAWDP